MAEGALPMPTNLPLNKHNTHAGHTRHVSRAFGSLGFLAIICLGAGIYLLKEALTDPLHADDGLFTGAFVVSCAACPHSKARPSALASGVHIVPGCGRSQPVVKQSTLSLSDWPLGSNSSLTTEQHSRGNPRTALPQAMSLSAKNCLRLNVV
jgi:hypothetical protein